MFNKDLQRNVPSSAVLQNPLIETNGPSMVYSQYGALYSSENE